MKEFALNQRGPMWSPRAIFGPLWIYEWPGRYFPVIIDIANYDVP
jgi:hypothetical protein